MGDFIVLSPRILESLTPSKLTDFSISKEYEKHIRQQYSHFYKQIILIYNVDILPQKNENNLGKLKQ